MNQVGGLMSENHKILIDMGLSHEKLIYLCNMALEKGALGAKLTGGAEWEAIWSLCPRVRTSRRQLFRPLRRRGLQLFEQYSVETNLFYG